MKEADPSTRIILKNAHGNVISRNSTSLSNFLGDSNSPLDSELSLVEATRGRESIVSILKDAGIIEMSPSDVSKLPTSSNVAHLYGSTPIILGLDRCEEFRRRVPVQNRFVGVAGMFNSGSTAFGISLQANCHFPNRRSKDYSNDLVKDVGGMLNQVPWAKHKDARWKYNFTIQPDIPKDNVLPIVLVRDPYFWMQSMCKQGYGAHWNHNPDQHCPNLVPNNYDRRRFKGLRNATSVRVWMGPGPRKGPSWDSLVHLWNDWYDSYVLADFPRLLVRFEDTLFHGKEVMAQVCQCAGAQSSSRFRYVVDEAKFDHRHAQNNMVSAMIKYGTDKRRFYNMTEEDLRFAPQFLSPKLMKMFQYQF